MQTPGRRVESLTPMIAINRRVNTIFERLSKVEEDVVEIERPQRRMFGRILSQFQTVNSSMDTMEDLIRQDIAAKKRYYAEEKKILEKDSRNLQNVNSGLGRQLAAGALGAVGISQILQGNIGEGAAGIGGAAALLTPEILGVISTVVTTRLVKSGLLGRGAGAGTLGTRVAGASKLRNPLLITAALAASLILPGLINSNQTADRRRQLSATRTIRGAETINKPDVDRFRVVIARFDSILSNISLERKRKGKGVIDEDITDELDEDDKNNEGDVLTRDEVINNPDLNPSDFAENTATGEVRKIDEMPFDVRAGFETRKFIDKFFNMFNKNKTENDDLSMIDNSFSGSEFIMNNNQSQNVAFGDIGSNFINNFSNLGNLSFDFINNNFTKNENDRNASEQGVNDMIVDLSQEDSQSNSSGFSALTATPTFVSVGTKFTSSGGAIDKFVSANALGAGMGLA
tara:strand:- start:1948 stop:3324 length:1377 start_codon:yes stop_codon:yes gene_type:complete